MKVKFYLSIGYPGAVHEDIIDFEDNATDREIEGIYQDWKNDLIDGYWAKIKKEREKI